MCGSDHTLKQMRKNDQKNILETNVGGKRPLGASTGDALHPDDHGVAAVHFASAELTLLHIQGF